MRIGILEPDHFSPDVLKHLATMGDVYCFEGGELATFLAPLEVLFVRLGYRLDEGFLSQAPNLRYLCSPTTGHLHFDEAALSARNIDIVSLRGEREFLDTVRATPEHTFGLILALLRRYKEALSHVESGLWDRNLLCGNELYGKTVGVIGLGRVGYRVASYCTAFGAKIVFCDVKQVVSSDEWKRFSDIKSVISDSDIVVLAASYVSGEPPIIGSDEIDIIKGRYFINTARGELVDEKAMLKAVEKDWFPGLATDVISAETDSNHLEEWRNVARGRNVIITPHIGGATVNSMARTERFIAKRLEQKIMTAV